MIKCNTKIEKVFIYSLNVISLQYLQVIHLKNTFLNMRAIIKYRLYSKKKKKKFIQTKQNIKMKKEIVSSKTFEKFSGFG